MSITITIIIIIIIINNSNKNNLMSNWLGPVFNPLSFHKNIYLKRKLLRRLLDFKLINTGISPLTIGIV